MTIKVLQPEGWSAPRGYSNGMMADGPVIYVGGQIGWTADQKFNATDFCGQLEQTLKNIVAVLSAAGARPNQVTRMTWYMTNKREYLDNARRVGEVYRSVMGKHFPAMTAVEVKSLMEDQALIEIEATAVLTD